MGIRDDRDFFCIPPSPETALIKDDESPVDKKGIDAQNTSTSVHLFRVDHDNFHCIPVADRIEDDESPAGKKVY